MKALTQALLLLTLAGCVHMRSLSTTSVPMDRSKPVEAQGYRLIILLFNFNNTYVDTLTQDLAAQCPGGRVEGILTKAEDIVYFPIIAHAVKVTAKGYCVESP